MSLVITLLVIVPLFMLIGSALLWLQRRETIPGPKVQPTKKDTRTTQSSPAPDLAKLQETLINQQKQLESLPERTAEMAKIIEKLGKTVETLNNEMAREKSEKSELLKDLDRSRRVAEEATTLIDLVKKKDNHASWRERVDAELQITGDHCTDVAMRMAREIENLVRESYTRVAGPSAEPLPSFRQRLKELSRHGVISNKQVDLIYKTWRIRNAISHESTKKASRAEGYALVEALDILITASSAPTVKPNV